jgi:hypothetical protein
MALILKTFSKNVTTAGTRVALSATKLYTTAFAVRAKSANTGVIYIGDSTVTSSTGMFLASGEANSKEGKTNARGTIQTFNLEKIYIDSSVNGEGVIVEYIAEEP